MPDILFSILILAFSWQVILNFREDAIIAAMKMVWHDAHFLRCCRHMSGNVESHIRDPKRNPNIKNKVVDRILRALFENEDCLAASLSWEEFRDRELEIANEYENYFDFDYFEKIVKVIKGNVQVRMKLKKPPPYNIKTNIVESEHAR